MVFQPVITPFLLIPLGLAVLGFGVFLTVKAGKEGRWKWLRRTFILALTVLLLARPGFYALQEQETYTNEFDVYFVVDVTSSMMAEDWKPDSDETRLEAAKQDIKKLVQAYPDARYGLIAADTNSRIVTPLTRDSVAFMTGVDYLEPEITRYSQGSNPAQFLNLLNETLAQNSETNPNRASLVFVFSDGEVTNDTIEITPPAKISEYISAGGVLGYGTEAGGRMKVQQGYYISADKGYITDPTTGQPAVSKIDEVNLEEMANVLGVPYTHRTPDTNYTPPGMESSLEMSGVKSIRTIADYSWVVASVLILFLIFEAGVLTNKYRREKLLLEQVGNND